MNNLSLKISNPAKHMSAPKIQKFSESEKMRIAKAAKDFESLMTSMMLKSMNKTTGGLFGKNNYGGDILDTVFESQIAQHMTAKKGMGIADVIFKNMTGENLAEQLMKMELKNAQANKFLNHNNRKKLQPSLQAKDRLKTYENIIIDAANKYDVDHKLIKSIILTESAANEKAVSKANAKGLMQLMDSTATYLGVKDSFDPKQNIEGGTKYFAELFRKYDGDVKKALAAYNAGPANVEKYNGIPPFKETQNYVKRVLSYFENMDI